MRYSAIAGIGSICVVVVLVFLYMLNSTYQSPYSTNIISTQLEICEHMISEKDLNWCKETLEYYLSTMCGFFDKPKICSDPRIEEIRKKQSSDLPDINSFEEVLDPQNINLITYKNHEYNFQIDYPKKWAIGERIGTIKNIVGFKDKPSYPFVVFLIQENYDQENSFDVFISKYKSELSEDDPISIGYENKTRIGNIEAYEIFYMTNIGETECFAKEYVMNLGKFVPVFQHERCEKNHYEAYLPIFDRMAHTFKTIT